MRALRHGISLAALLTLLLAAAFPADPLGRCDNGQPSEVADGNDKLHWLARTEEDAGDKGWWMGHCVKYVGGQKGYLRVVWRPGIYQGYVKMDGKWNGSSTTGGVQPEEHKDGTIEYGKEGMQPNVVYFTRRKDEKWGQAPRELKTDVSVTVEMTEGKEDFKDVDLEAASVVTATAIEYTIRFTGKLPSEEVKDLLDELRVDWQAAASPESARVIVAENARNKVTPKWFLRLDPEKREVKFEVPRKADDKVILRDGWLVVTDKSGRRLGGAHAPAYGTPNFLGAVAGITDTLKVTSPLMNGDEREYLFKIDDRLPLLDASGKPAKIAAFTPGERVTLMQKGDKVVGIQKVVDAEPPEERSPGPKEARGTIKVVDADKGKITVTVDGKDEIYTVSKDSKITIGGKEAKLVDLKENSKVTVVYKQDGDETTVQSIIKK